MRYDKQSFLAGLHTGLRLGRDPIGRNPPAPHEKYILTEDGIPIITEYSEPQPYGDVSIYMFGVWYWAGSQYMSVIWDDDYFADAYFYWDNGSFMELVVYSHSSLYRMTNGVWTRVQGGEAQRRSTTYYSSDGDKVKDIYFGSTPINSTYIPDDTVPFTGTREELFSWLETVDYDYIITE